MNDFEDNEILAEIRRIKDEIAAECNYDVHVRGAQLREMERTSGDVYHELYRDGSRSLWQYGKKIAFVPAGVDYKDVLQQLAASK